MTVAGRELPRFITDLTWYLRNLLLAQSGEDLSEALEMSGEQMKLLAHEAKVYAPEELMRYISVLCELTNRLRHESQKRVLIEMTVVRLCRPQVDVDNEAVLDRIRRLENELAVLRRTGVSAPAEEPEEEEAPKEKLKVALPESILDVVKNWQTLCQMAPHPTRMAMRVCTPSLSRSGNLLMVFTSPTDYNLINSENHIEQVEKTIEKTIHQTVKVEIELLKEGESPAQYVDLSEAVAGRLGDVEIEII